MSKYLYQLIRGLAPAEKRYFDLWSGRYGSNRQYLVVYNEINAMLSEKAEMDAVETAPDLDEKQLIARLKQKGLEQASFSDAKDYLYEMLLSSLRIQHEKETQEYSIKTSIQEAKVLERRGMPEAAMEKYNAALKDAQKYQQHGAAIDALRCLVTLTAQFDPKNYSEVIQNYLKALDAAAAHLKEELHLFRHNFLAFVLVRTQKSFTDAARKNQIAQLSETLYAIRDTPETFFAQIYGYSTEASLSILEKRREDTRKHYLQIIGIWDDPPNQHLKEEHLRSYIIFLGNYLTYCVSTKDYESFQKYFQRMKDIKPANADDEAEYFQNLKYVEHFYLLNRGMLEVAAQLFPDIERGLTKYAAKINKARERTLRFNMMLTCVGLEQYDEALRHLGHLLGKSPHREDLSTAAKLFELIIQYEQRNHAALDTRIRSLTENLKYNDNLHDFERTVLKHLSKLIRLQQSNLPGSKQENPETPAVLEAFQSALQTLKADQKFEKPSGFEAILLWVRSKREHKPFRDLLMD